MLKKIRKLSLSQKKIILWTVTIFVGVLMFSWQILIVKKTIQNTEIKKVSLIKEEEKKEMSEKREEINDDFEVVKKEIRATVELEEEEIINNLKEEGLIDEEELEELIKNEGINKEDLEKGDLLQIIIEKDLIKEKNEGEKE